jgi:hypothetical protein
MDAKMKDFQACLNEVYHADGRDLLHGRGGGDEDESVSRCSHVSLLTHSPQANDIIASLHR